MTQFSRVFLPNILSLSRILSACIARKVDGVSHHSVSRSVSLLQIKLRHLKLLGQYKVIFGPIFKKLPQNCLNVLKLDFKRVIFQLKIFFLAFNFGDV